MFVQLMYTVYSVLLSPLGLKSVPGWPAISVSTFQQSRVGQIVWFGSLSAISQLASRGGGMGSWATLCLHSVTQPYTTCPRWREQGGGLRSLPLDPSRFPLGLLYLERYTQRVFRHGHSSFTPKVENPYFVRRYLLMSEYLEFFCR
jgi:hypothetical protein